MTSLPDTSTSYHTGQFFLFTLYAVAAVVVVVVDAVVMLVDVFTKDCHSQSVAAAAAANNNNLVS